MLEVLKCVLRADRLIVVNLCTASAKDLPALSEVARTWEPWASAQPSISAGLAASDDVLMAWGLSELLGPAKRHRLRQLDWFRETAIEHMHQTAWTIGGEPRHPSRWHQFVSDRHARTRGGTTYARLSEVLVRTDINNLLRPVRPPREPK